MTSTLNPFHHEDAIAADILVVDDTPANLRLIAKMLTDQSYRVRSVTSGSMALKAAQAKRPDLILLDINMPEMNGYQVCRHLKEHPVTATVPVIFLSALSDANDKVQAFSSGGVDYITKPFQVEEVLARVKNHLKLQRVQGELAEQSLILSQFSTNLKALHRLDTTEHPTLADRFTDYLITGCKIFNLRSGSVSHVNDGHYHLVASHTPEGQLRPRDGVPLGETYSGQVVQSERTLAFHDRAQVPELPAAITSEDLGVQAFLGAPLWVRGQVYGTLVFMDREPRSRPFTKQEIEILELMAESLGRVITMQQAEDRRAKAEMALRLEKQRSENLLFDVLPKKIAQRLTRETEPIAEHFPATTILFADIVGFTALSSQMRPFDLVQMLNAIFSEFDHLVERMGLEKIKTVGDAYMVAGGLPVERSDHIEAIADLALAMQQTVTAFRPTGVAVQLTDTVKIRIGIHTGAVVAGIIGTTRFTYDLWGDTVNVASRMESTGEAGKIQVTTCVYEELRDRYDFEVRGEVDIKGKGIMTTYWLKGRQAGL